MDATTPNIVGQQCWELSMIARVNIDLNRTVVTGVDSN